MHLKGRSVLSKLYYSRTLILMALPAVIICFLLAYLPLSGIIIAFKNYNYTDGIFRSPWTGFSNFRFFFLSGKAFAVTKNTMLFNLVFMVTGTFTSVTIAIFVAEMSGRYFKKICQSFMFLPFFISWVVVSAFMYNIFNYDTGVLNSFLKQAGINPVDIYNESGLWYFILPVLNIWKYSGYGSVIYLAAIMGFDGEYYEAAVIDGASRFQRIFHITVPMLVPTITILLLLSLGRILRGDFEMFYQIIGANSVLYDTTDIIDTFVFRSLVNYNDLSMTSAAALYQSVLCFIIIVFTNGFIKKYHKDYALF